MSIADLKPGYGHGREALLRAAITLVSTTGLRNLTYRSVAAEAGVTHGLVRHHFGSRDALIEAALDYALELSIADSSLDAQITSLDQFASSLDALIDLDPNLQAFQFELVLESRRNPELVPYVEKLYEGYRSATRLSLKSLGIVDRGLAELVFAALDGLAFQQVAFGTSAQTRRGVLALQELLATANHAETASPTHGEAN